MVRTCLGACLALALMATAASAQTNQARPDFSGVWRLGIHPGYVLNIASDLGPTEIVASAAQLFAKRASDFGSSDPATSRCLPFGPRHIIGGGMVERVRIVQSADAIAFLYEDLAYRDVPLSGRSSNAGAPSYMGHGLGEWQGDVLVIRTVGFTNRTWLDYTGHSNSEALEITERYRLAGPDRISREVQIVDPDTFTRPITVPTELNRATDEPAMLEYLCAENNKPGSWSAGRAGRPVTVPQVVLDRYVGDYRAGQGTAAFTVSISRDGTGLVANIDGKGRVPLTALSRTSFSGSILGTYEFQTNKTGGAIRLLIYSVGVDGVMEAPRIAGPGPDGRTARGSAVSGAGR